MSRKKNDIMVRNFGTGLWGCSDVVVKVSIFSGDVDIVDANDNSNVITIKSDVAKTIADAINNQKES